MGDGMSDGIELVVYSSDDWDAVYVDGKKIYSGHEDLIDVILHAVSGKTVAVARYGGYAERGYPLGQYLYEHGDFPDTLNEIEAICGTTEGVR